MWTVYKVQSENGLVDYETDDIDVLEATVKELLNTMPKQEIHIVSDMDFILDVALDDSEWTVSHN